MHGYSHDSWPFRVNSGGREDGRESTQKLNLQGLPRPAWQPLDFATPFFRSQISISQSGTKRTLQRGNMQNAWPGPESSIFNLWGQCAFLQWHWRPPAHCMYYAMLTLAYGLVSFQIPWNGTAAVVEVVGVGGPIAKAALTRRGHTQFVPLSQTVCFRHSRYDLQQNSNLAISYFVHAAR